MSSPNCLDYLVRQEQYKDLLFQAQQDRMVKILKPRPRRYRVDARWIGAQVMNWSSTLQSYISQAGATGLAKSHVRGAKHPFRFASGAKCVAPGSTPLKGEVISNDKDFRLNEQPG